MHIIDVIDEIADKLTELQDDQIADIYNQLAEWGVVNYTLESAGEGQFNVQGDEDE